VLDKEGAEVHPVLHVGVKGVVDDAHLRASHGPPVSPMPKIEFIKKVVK
jgi:hypothetical protein